VHCRIGHLPLRTSQNARNRRRCVRHPLASAGGSHREKMASRDLVGVFQSSAGGTKNRDRYRQALPHPLKAVVQAIRRAFVASSACGDWAGGAPRSEKRLGRPRRLEAPSNWSPLFRRRNNRCRCTAERRVGSWHWLCLPHSRLSTPNA
jgi:hypothetical protein